jgi:hypothetical protein
MRPTPRATEEQAVASLYRQDTYRVRYSALPLAVLWLVVLTGLAYAESWALVPRSVLLLVTTVTAVAALLHLGHASFRLYWAARTYRRSLPGFVYRMIGLFPKLARFRSEVTKILLHTGLALFGVALAAALGVYAVLAPSALLLGIAITAGMRVVLPPGGVYLASSNPERVIFFGQLSKRTIPGFAALLELSNLVTPNDDGYLGHLVGLLNDFRTTDPDDWRDVVKYLIEMAAFVVVDGRDQSPGVEFEVARILRNRLEFKTGFLSSDGEIPSVLRRLNAKSSHPSGEFLLMTPDQALHAVPAVIMGAKAFWIPVRLDA